MAPSSARPQRGKGKGTPTASPTNDGVGVDVADRKAVASMRAGKYYVASETRFTVRAFKNEKQGGVPKWKPDGLWFACGKSWIDWVSHEVPERYRQYKYLYELHVDKTHIKTIKTVLQLKAFNKKYGLGSFYSAVVDWERLQKEGYRGVAICPLLIRKIPYDVVDRELNWYSTWDAASGCVWDRAALQGATLIHTFSHGASR